jgi:hypothetical protein
VHTNTSISDSKTVVSIFDAKTVLTLATLFQDEMIPAEVIANGERWDIQVPGEFFVPALRLYEKWKLSDAELSYLATGSLED